MVIFESKQNSTEQISQGLQAFTELDQDIQEKKIEPAQSSRELENNPFPHRTDKNKQTPLYNPEEGDKEETRLKESRNSAAWGETPR